MDMTHIDWYIFDECDLRDRDLSERNLVGAHFIKANGRGTFFLKAQLKDAHFEGADLRDAYFVGADLSLLLHDPAQIAIHMFRDEPQRHLAQRGEIALAKKIIRGGRGAIPEIDLAIREPRPQLLRREIDQDDLVRHVEHRIRHRLAHHDAGDLLHRVAAAFDVLNIQRGEDVDAGLEQLDDILITFWVARTGSVCVRQFIDHREARMPEQDRVEIHLGERRAAVFQLRARRDRQAVDERFGFCSSVCFHNPNHDLAVVALLLPSRLQHGVSLADAGTHPEENLEPAASRGLLLALDPREELIRVSATVVSHGALQNSN